MGCGGAGLTAKPYSCWPLAFAARTATCGESTDGNSRTAMSRGLPSSSRMTGEREGFDYAFFPYLFVLELLDNGHRAFVRGLIFVHRFHGPPSERRLLFSF